MTKLSVSLNGHQTSISLESEFIDALKKIAENDNITISSIINTIDISRARDTNLSSEIRIYILKYFMKQF
jgi:predicted DNA-binding ribbon-helix-helix protein